MKRDYPEISALLRRAAERFYNDKELYGVCAAISHESHRAVSYFESDEERAAKGFLRAVYQRDPTNPHRNTLYWLGPFTRENREVRVMCLLFAAELWDSGWEAGNE